MTTAPNILSGSPPSGDRIVVDGRTAIVAGVVAVAAMVTVFWDWFRSQVRWAIEMPSDWGHTLLIPAIAGWFVWIKRDRILAEPLRPAWSGLPLIVLGVAAYAACVFGPATLQHHNTRGFAVGLTFFGLVLLVTGWAWMKWLWFPICYVIAFGQTISERFLSIVTYKLQDISAKGAYILLGLFGMDVDLTGNVLTVFQDGNPHQLNVAEACSGMRMLVAFMALGVAMAYVSLPTIWQRVTLVVMGVPVAVFVNVLRVASLGVLSLFDSEFAAGEFHHFIGLVWLVPAFLLYLLVLWILTNLVVQGPTGKEAGHAG
ncbi:MAG: exosortase/archaeosortase family protein [Phycisphaerales bacterium]